MTLLLFLLACTPAPHQPDLPDLGTSDGPNVLLVIADDLGVDRVRAYGEHPDAPPTPTLDGLAERGLLFRQAFAYPVCSPTRASMLTGRYAFRTGIGWWIHRSQDYGLPTDTLSVATVLGHVGYETAALGKWHVAGRSQGARHPLDMGFQHHAGSLYNLSNGEDYFGWLKAVDGESHWTDTYATSDTVDEALAFTGAAEEPWFAWVAFNAPHVPIHAPPADLHTRVLGEEPSRVALHGAMIEAMDTELGRLLDGVDLERTIVIFVGDNGTEGTLKTEPSERAGKHTLYEGGIHVPLLVAGPGVAQGETAALVSVTDLFATILELGEADVDPADAVSFAPVLADPERAAREVVFLEKFRPNGPGPYDWHDEVLREARWKYLRVEGREELYDLEADPGEAQDLMLAARSAEAEAALERLRTTAP